MSGNAERSRAMLSRECKRSKTSRYVKERRVALQTWRKGILYLVPALSSGKFQRNISQPHRFEELTPSYIFVLYLSPNELSWKQYESLIIKSMCQGCVSLTLWKERDVYVK